MITLDDFVMLGKTVPEPNSDGRIFVCSAGVVPDRGLVRIYPLARRAAPQRWMRTSVAVERNPKDSRPESFRLAGDRRPGEHTVINAEFRPRGTVKLPARSGLLAPYVINSVAEADARRRSLAIIHPEAVQLYLQHNPESPDSPQQSLFDGVEDRPIPKGAKRFAYNPRIRFSDECGDHDLQVRDWGVYELLRKRGSDYAQRHLAAALHLTPQSSLLVGNMNNHRTSWLVISVINGLRPMPSLFDTPETDEGWHRLPRATRRRIYEDHGWACRTCSSIERLTGVQDGWGYRVCCETCLEEPR